ncbi:putative uracil permease [Hyella patelloides LEGE 07179]|uniref:Putative uracil permease n=1 Tax=Hyella patelloides LEGE 07179 TaxID=945734 RepID=A0A563W2F9_9CYAN|nr:solute carrier family 23 protein [Hyella patelloides]VEP17894.1 putative uracil permease [Hyella patelloides LEGE 07179]
MTKFRDISSEASEDTTVLATTYKFRIRDFLVGVQMLFVAFGALVLVPILAGLDPNVALFTSGLGTLCFQLVTGGKVPVYLASSFAFIAPITLSVEKFGLAETLSGLAVAGVLYLVLSLIVFWRGSAIISRILPAIVTGPVIMVIGLSLAPIAVAMASEAGEGYSRAIVIAIATVSLLATMLAAILARGFLKLIAILFGIVAGYLVSLPFGLVDFSAVGQATWLQIPSFTVPSFHLPAILFILPVAIAPAIEHIGDVLAIGSVTGNNYLRDPGIHRTLLGDGLATTLAAFLGGPPNTTYSEVTGAVALTQAFNPGIMTWAALTAITLSFCGKLGAIIQTIPVPVMGGILIVLFGTIVVIGINSMIQARDDLLQPRNIAIVSAILILGVGGMSISAGTFALEGIGLSSIIGVLLNLLLPRSSLDNNQVKKQIE